MSGGLISRDASDRGTILMVADDEVQSRLPVRFLKHVGFAVLEARSGEQALQIVRDRRPPIDLLLTDVQMPWMNGLELAGWTLSECPAPQTILMACQQRRSVERALIRGRSVPILPKPLDLDQLLELLRVMLPPLPPVDDVRPRSGPKPGSVGRRRRRDPQIPVREPANFSD
jgi:CheY-like chemotaxis protein